MRRIPIRIKLAAALAVPVLAMGLVTLIEVVSVDRDAREVRDQTNLAKATIGPKGLITSLQNERNWTAAQLVGVDQQLALDVTGYDADPGRDGRLPRRVRATSSTDAVRRRRPRTPRRSTP